MSKKFTVILILLGVLAIGMFAGLGIWRSKSTTPSFADGGYILKEEADGVRQMGFAAGTEYVTDISGNISFTGSGGERHSIDRRSYVFFNNSGVMALSDGVLLDFNDLSENFINNYYISQTLPIRESGGVYTAETVNGSMSFGENVWKMADNYYLIQSPTLTVCLSANDSYPVEDYVLVHVTDDGVAHLLSREEVWMTISPECYIETEGGVRIYPISQLVDDGNYKLSLAKLAVNPEDAIVLTEDETRRQIVPELNIETIDGEDGEDGADGEAGVDGESGESGDDGVDGNKGETGKGGDIGGQGGGGNPGNKGSDGKNAVLESSANSALPTVTINEWNAGSDSLKGSFKITDIGEFFIAMQDVSDTDVYYPAKATLTNLKTGEIIDVYQTTDDKYAFDETQSLIFRDIYEGKGEVFFSTGDGVLDPDTEYRLSLTAYYKTADEGGMIYSREFLTRTFYTDSTGLSLRYVKATTDTVTIAADIHADKKNLISGAKVYLLTPEQNAAFSTGSVNDTSNYVEMLPAINGDGSVNEMVFGLAEGKELDPNTKYIARVIVDSTGLTVLSEQELAVATLKRTPTTEDGAKPTVTYNRVTGSFEVWRPKVSDPDNGVQSYTYTAYYLDENGSRVNVAKRNVSTSASEPIEFQLEPEKDYYFEVELEFYDNEKTIYYNLGSSDSIRTEGDTLPRLTLNVISNEYNQYRGTLNINLASGFTHMTVDGDHPMHLELVADQVQDSKLTLTTMGENVYIAGTDEDGGNYQGYVQLLETPTLTNYLGVSLNLDNLKKNTNYTLTVYGYIDLNDGNGLTYRAIGTVSLMTKDVVGLGVQWSRPDEAIDTAFSRTLRVYVQDGTAGDRTNYALEELKNGEITAELYSGTGVGMLLIREAVFSDPDILAQIYSEEGYDVSELDFGNVALDSNGTYTLRIDSIVDSSANMVLGYENEFDKLTQMPEVVAAEPTPPDLLEDPSTGVTAAPILNKDAGNFGLTMDEKLPEDTVIGYTLESTYKNDQGIGRSVSYYAFELKAFFNALSNGQDPVLRSEPLLKMTQAIPEGSDTMPKVAVIFGGTKSTDATATYTGNGYYLYYTGTASAPADSLLSGMGRGFRYIFAYTVEYVGSTVGDSGAMKTYPYDHKQYRSFNASYGGLSYNSANIGRGTAYILHSGIQELPFVMPEFFSYVAESELTKTGEFTSGKVTLHYSWRDPDGMVSTTTNNETEIQFKDAETNMDVTQPINLTSVSGAKNWYSVTIPYLVRKYDAVMTLLEPSLIMSEYDIDYTVVLNHFGMETDSGLYELAKIPVEYNWRAEFDSLTDSAKQLQIDVKEEENCIDFIFVNTSAANEFRQRAVGMKLTVQVENEPDTAKEFFLPLTQDAQTYARLATGLLGSEFIGRTFEVTEALLIYDTGVQGWSLAELSDKNSVSYSDSLWYSSYYEDKNDGDKVLAPYLIQFTNAVGTDASFTFSNYITSYSTAEIPANGAALLPSDSDTFSLANLRNTVNLSDAELDAKTRIWFYHIITGVGTTRYLYASHFGVDTHTERSMENMSGRYAVPKQTAALTLSFTLNAAGEPDNKAQISTVTPTVLLSSFVSTATTIGVNSLRVEGLEAGKQIYMAAYTSYALAEKLGPDWQGLGPIAIDITNGVPSNWPGLGTDPVVERYPTIRGLEGSLEEAKRYYIVFYYYDLNNEPVVLLRGDKAEKAIWSASTSSGVVVTVTENNYLNTSYNDKKLEIGFDLSRAFNVTLRYDLFSSMDAALAEDGVPLLTYEQLLGYETAEALEEAGGIPNEKTILTVPAQVVQDGNLLTINLTPSDNRKLLPPGRTYYIKFTAYETGDVYAGSHVEAFTITDIGNYNAYVAIGELTAESVDFKVTINDPQNSFMAPSGASGATGGGYYAVRFTDGNGKRLHTVYDYQIYQSVTYGADNMPQMQRTFTLSNDTLTRAGVSMGEKIEPDKEYRIHVYAMNDDNHDGSIIEVNDATSTPHNADYYFAGYDAAVTDRPSCKFQELIETFWNSANENVPALDYTIESQLLVGERSQRTALEAGWLLNTTRVYSERVDSKTMRVVMEDSFGLIQDVDGFKEYVFKRIDWQVNGSASSGKPVFVEKTELLSAGGVMLEEGVSAGGNNMYYFTIPIDVLKGSYDIILQLRQGENDVSPYAKLTLFCS